MSLFLDVSKYILRKAFDIREGEILRTFLMQAYIFLVISSLLILKPTVTSLFLSNFGVDQLPYAFLLVAISAAAVSSIYSRILKSISLDKIIIRTILLSSFSLFSFWLLLKLDLFQSWILYLFYVWVAIYAILVASQFWILANILFNAREAKRLFGFIGAGAIAGGIFGGYLTSIFAGIIGSENLLLICIFFISFCIPITKYLWKKNVHYTLTKFQKTKRVKNFAESPINLIRRSKHLIFLASIVGVSVVVAKLVDYQFSAIASEKITDENELTAFFGFWFSNLSIVSLLIQLFLTRRVVGIFGVGTSLFFLPVGILAGSLAVFIAPAIWSVVFLKISDGSLKQSINKSAVELLALPIPTEIKNQTKSFIDIFVDSFATGVGGILLIIFAGALNLSVQFISFITIALLIFWIYLAFRVRREYIRSFRSKVEEIDDEEFALPDLSNESVIGSLIKVLEEGSDTQIIQTLKMLIEIQDDRFLPAFEKLLDNDSAELKKELLKNLYFYRSKTFIPQIENLIEHDDQELRVEAFDYLFEHVIDDNVTYINKYLRNDNYKISDAALLGAAQETRDNPDLRIILQLDEVIDDKLEDSKRSDDAARLINTKIICAKAIGISTLKARYDLLKEFLNDENSEVRKAAVFGCGRTLDPQFIPILINLMKEKEFLPFIKEALGFYGSGITDLLDEYIYKENIDSKIKRNIPAIFENLPHQKAVDKLYIYLESDDFVIRSEALKSLNHIRKKYPHLKFERKGLEKKILNEAKLYFDTLAVLYSQINAESNNGARNSTAEKHWSNARKSLIELLEKQLDGALERIFRLLGLKYPPDDMLDTFKGIRSSQPDMRINSIEYLDNLLGPNLKRVIIPIAETASMDLLSDDAISELQLKIPSDIECFEMILHGSDLKLINATLNLITESADKKYSKLVDSIVEHPNEKIKTMAQLAKAAINKS